MTYETPPVEGGVRGDQLPSMSRSPLTVYDLRAQHLVARFGIPATRAATIAPLVFGEVVHG